MIIALIVLAVVVVVLAGMIVNDRAGSGSNLPEGAARVIDDYRDAFVNQDVDAFWAVITDDYFSREYYYGANSHTLWKDWVEETGPESNAFAIEFKDPVELLEIRDVLVSGDGPWIVSANEIWQSANGFRWDGTFTRVVVDQAGTMKIANDIFAGIISEVEN